MLPGPLSGLPHTSSSTLPSTNKKPTVVPQEFEHFYTTISPQTPSGQNKTQYLASRSISDSLSTLADDESTGGTIKLYKTIESTFQALESETTNSHPTRAQMDRAVYLLNNLDNLVPTGDNARLDAAAPAKKKLISGTDAHSGNSNFDFLYNKILAYVAQHSSPYFPPEITKAKSSTTPTDYREQYSLYYDLVATEAQYKRSGGDSKKDYTLSYSTTSSTRSQMNVYYQKHLTSLGQQIQKAIDDDVDLKLAIDIDPTTYTAVCTLMSAPDCRDYLSSDAQKKQIKAEQGQIKAQIGELSEKIRKAQATLDQKPQPLSLIQQDPIKQELQIATDKRAVLIAQTQRLGGVLSSYKKMMALFNPKNNKLILVDKENAALFVLLLDQVKKYSNKLSFNLADKNKRMPINEAAYLAYANKLPQVDGKIPRTLLTTPNVPAETDPHTPEEITADATGALAALDLSNANAAEKAATELAKQIHILHLENPNSPLALGLIQFDAAKKKYEISPWLKNPRLLKLLNEKLALLRPKLEMTLKPGLDKLPSILGDENSLITAAMKATEFATVQKAGVISLGVKASPSSSSVVAVGAEFALPDQDTSTVRTAMNIHYQAHIDTLLKLARIGLAQSVYPYDATVSAAAYEALYAITSELNDYLQNPTIIPGINAEIAIAALKISDSSKLLAPNAIPQPSSAEIQQHTKQLQVATTSKAALELRLAHITKFAPIVSELFNTLTAAVDVAGHNQKKLTFADKATLAKTEQALVELQSYSDQLAVNVREDRLHLGGAYVAYANQLPPNGNNTFMRVMHTHLDPIVETDPADVPSLQQLAAQMPTVKILAAKYLAQARIDLALDVPAMAAINGAPGAFATYLADPANQAKLAVAVEYYTKEKATALAATVVEEHTINNLHPHSVHTLGLIQANAAKDHFEISPWLKDARLFALLNTKLAADPARLKITLQVGVLPSIAGDGNCHISAAHKAAEFATVGALPAVVLAAQPLPLVNNPLLAQQQGLGVVLPLQPVALSKKAQKKVARDERLRKAKEDAKAETRQNAMACNENVLKPIRTILIDKGINAGTITLLQVDAQYIQSTIKLLNTFKNYLSGNNQSVIGIQGLINFLNKKPNDKNQITLSVKKGEKDQPCYKLLLLLSKQNPHFPTFVESIKPAQQEAAI